MFFFLLEVTFIRPAGLAGYEISMISPVSKSWPTFNEDNVRGFLYSK